MLHLALFVCTLPSLCAQGHTALPYNRMSRMAWELWGIGGVTVCCVTTIRMYFLSRTITMGRRCLREIFKTFSTMKRWRRMLKHKQTILGELTLLSYSPPPCKNEAQVLLSSITSSWNDSSAYGIKSTLNQRWLKHFIPIPKEYLLCTELAFDQERATTQPWGLFAKALVTFFYLLTFEFHTHRIQTPCLVFFK